MTFITDELYSLFARENFVLLQVGFKYLSYEMQEPQSAYDSNSLYGKIKDLFEATTILHDEVHASVYEEKVKIFWLCSKKKFLSFDPYLNLLKSRFNHCPDSAIQ